MPYKYTFLSVDCLILQTTSTERGGDKVERSWAQFPEQPSCIYSFKLHNPLDRSQLLKIFSLALSQLSSISNILQLHADRFAHSTTSITFFRTLRDPPSPLLPTGSRWNRSPLGLAPTGLFAAGFEPWSRLWGADVVMIWRSTGLLSPSQAPRIKSCDTCVLISSTNHLL